ncbi:acyl-CoA thioesterase [Saccharopolyspora pogona]|uniref:acyl-CoA thioesterase n=1 Tax=Saccharopolyspora pogona TaxID=333966 RepID=UPI001CC23867|nr:thioesterase family protein [Saccharopolyspora pogona]
MPFTHTHQVRYHETDAQSYLFNSRYLEIADVAMTEFFRHLGWPYQALNAGGVDPSVVSARIEFRAPAFFDDLIDFRVECTRVGRSSFELRHVVTRSETELAEINVVYANVDASENRARPLPDAVSAALSSHGRAP